VLQASDSVVIDARKFKDIEVFLNEEKIDFNYNDTQIVINKAFKQGETHQLKINWSANPKKALYFIGWETEGRNQIWTQGQGKYTSNWLPCFDDTNQKVEFDLNITFQKDYEVIANGELITKEENEDAFVWHYDMKQPMSSYLLAFAIGNYKKKEMTSKSGVPLELYYYPEDSMRIEPTYRYSKEIFDFLEDEIGVAYPWQNYKQIPVKDFLYAGMENTSTTIFSDAFVIDSKAFVDKNYVNVNAHELAHQWFGDLVTATSGKHHWLQEGFATYYALLAEQSIFGEDYYYWRLYEYVEELLTQDAAGKSTSLLDAKSSSTTFYKKGALVLHVLREKVGEEAFKEAVVNYLTAHKFKNVETKYFISEVEKTAAIDLSEFVEQWLTKAELPIDAIEESLYKNSIVKQYDLLSCHDSKCDKIVSEDLPENVLNKIIKQKPELITSKLFNIKSIKTRQVIAQSLQEIPFTLKADYETLLNDKSYLTIEAALYNLWVNFPSDRKTYLEKTKNYIGFNDKNVRMLWLVLALNTPEYNSEKDETYYKELVNYTSPKYHFEVRENAFRYLSQSNLCNEHCLEHLKDAATHHNWRFKKFAKQLLETKQ
jgi:aminopeptidase N